MKKALIFTLFLVSLGLAVSACVKKPAVQPAVNNNVTPSNIEGQNTNTATTTSEIDTSDWKTYRNEEYGFEFKYPKDYILMAEGSSEVIFEKEFKPGMPSSKIHSRIYPNQAIEAVIQIREEGINEGIFANEFKKIIDAEGGEIYALDHYGDALGAAQYSERVIKMNSMNVVVTIQVMSIPSDEFNKLYEFLRRINKL